MAFRLGMDAKLFYGTAGAAANTPLGNVRNVTLNLERGEADVTTRANQGWRATVGTLKEATLEFEMVWDTNDAGFTAIRQAFLGQSPYGSGVLALRALDGTNGQGLEADCMILSFSRNESLEEAITVNVSAKPTYSTRPPQWIVGGSAAAGSGSED
jgi:hypothetical protein